MPLNCATPAHYALSCPASSPKNLNLRRQHLNKLPVLLLWCSTLSETPQSCQQGVPHLPALSRPSSDTVWQVHDLRPYSLLLGPYCYRASSSQHVLSVPQSIALPLWDSTKPFLMQLIPALGTLLIHPSLCPWQLGSSVHSVAAWIAFRGCSKRKWK